MRLPHHWEAGLYVHCRFQPPARIREPHSTRSEVRYQLGGWPLDTPAMNPLRDADGVIKNGAVYFAGDQASELHGWQEGAVLSALAAVEGI